MTGGIPMKRTAAIAIAAALAATPAAAQSGDSSRLRSAWGLFADMAGHDYYYTNKGYAYAALRLEWIRPGEELRLVDLQNRKFVRDCRLVTTPTPGFLSGSCETGADKKPTRIEAEVDAEGNVMVATLYKDLLLGQQRQKWGRYRPGKTPGSLELRIAGIQSVPLRRADDPEVRIAPYAKWLTEALAGVGAPLPTGAAPAAPAPALPRPADEPPV